MGWEELSLTGVAVWTGPRTTLSLRSDIGEIPGNDPPKSTIGRKVSLIDGVGAIKSRTWAD